MHYGLVVIFSLLAAGCAVTPQLALSKRDAIARVRTVYGSGADTSRRLELPVNTTGTGPHDFYNLFARVSDNAPADYGISIATDRKVEHSDARVEARNLGTLKIEGRQQLSVALGQKVSYIEAVFGRGDLKQAATAGAEIVISSSRGTLTFRIPNWMFEALEEVADRNDSHRSNQETVARIAQMAEDTVREQKRTRELHIQNNPELSDRVKKAVLGGSIVLGMSREDTIASWGRPEKINRSVGEFGVHEQWIYGETYVYFENGKLTSWQD